MRTLLLMLITPLLLTACVTPGNPSKSGGLIACGSGHTPVNIKYGDSQITVNPPLSKVKQNSTLVFNLVPNKQANDRVDYEKVLVTIEGKTADSDWINASGTYDADKKLNVCVDPSQSVDVYEYLVKVDGVGQIDPRADVIR